MTWHSNYKWFELYAVIAHVFVLIKASVISFWSMSYEVKFKNSNVVSLSSVRKILRDCTAVPNLKMISREEVIVLGNQTCFW